MEQMPTCQQVDTGRKMSSCWQPGRKAKGSSFIHLRTKWLSLSPYHHLPRPTCSPTGSLLRWLTPALGLAASLCQILLVIQRSPTQYGCQWLLKCLIRPDGLLTALPVYCLSSALRDGLNCIPYQDTLKSYPCTCECDLTWK